MIPITPQQRKSPFRSLIFFTDLSSLFSLSKVRFFVMVVVVVVVVVVWPCRFGPMLLVVAGSLVA